MWKPRPMKSALNRVDLTTVIRERLRMRDCPGLAECPFAITPVRDGLGGWHVAVPAGVPPAELAAVLDVAAELKLFYALSDDMEAILPPRTSWKRSASSR